MNAILGFLNDNRNRLNLAAHGVDGPMAALMLTPRFHASSHVVFLVSSGDSCMPALVAKMARLPQPSMSLNREYANLNRAQELLGPHSPSIPQPIALEEIAGHPLLIESALAGRAMDPGFVRSEHDRACQAIVNWTCGLAWPQDTNAAAHQTRAEHLITEPFHYLLTHFPLNTEEQRLLDRSWCAVAPVRQLRLPVVIEHGDLSHPNLILLENGEPGVVDWETAEVHGLPAVDLFFFLTYVAFARARARKPEQQLTVFRNAFFGEQAWARYYVGIYAKRMGLPEAALTPLFVLCWLRYLVGLLVRLDNGSDSTADVSPATAHWLRKNRFYELWRYSVDHTQDLQWWGGRNASQER